MIKKFRSIAIHLPQFHPVKENDLWWGKGFTEWRNVSKAKPLYEGHYQPHIPADLGFYDLRLEESRIEQAELAKQFGIEGFCYYHYWFNGKRVLERPVNEIFESGKPDFPYMLCWANENWTRRWDGQEKDVLLSQEYSVEDDENHINYLMDFFKDPRYIKVDGKPVIIIYKAFLLPDPQKTADTWRRIAAEHGLKLYLCHMVFSYVQNFKKQPGFDAAIDFEPFGVRRKQDIFKELQDRQHFYFQHQSVLQKIKRKIFKFRPLEQTMKSYNTIEYEYCYNDLKALKKVGYKLFPGLTPGWDNTARKNTNPSLILHQSSPEKFKNWLQKIVNDFEPYSEEENFIFINAWNEWAEGNHLEPCLKWGTAYLKALKEVLEAVNEKKGLMEKVLI